MAVERVQILIDGGNLHHLVFKKLGIQELEFNFEGFVEFLANGRVITENGKRFYVGSVREREGDARSKQAMSRQTSVPKHYPEYTPQYYAVFFVDPDGTELEVAYY